MSAEQPDLAALVETLRALYDAMKAAKGEAAPVVAFMDAAVEHMPALLDAAEEAERGGQHVIVHRQGTDVVACACGTTFRTDAYGRTFPIDAVTQWNEHQARSEFGRATEIGDLTAERDAARAEVAALRDGIGRLADEYRRRCTEGPFGRGCLPSRPSTGPRHAHDCGVTSWDVADALRALLGPGGER